MIYGVTSASYHPNYNDGIFYHTMAKVLWMVRKVNTRKVYDCKTFRALCQINSMSSASFLFKTYAFITVPMVIQYTLLLTHTRVNLFIPYLRTVSVTKAMDQL